MAFADDIRPAAGRCEVCGAPLENEVVIQEFADGSLARLCPECAAGAAVDEHAEPETVDDVPADVWPVGPAEVGALSLADSDPLEKTRELLMPVADLIALQGEVQSALERLAASLEQFAAEVLTESQGRTAVESRLRMLERELQVTRARLEKTEFLLVGSSGNIPAGTSPAFPGEITEAPETAKPQVAPAAGATIKGDPERPSVVVPPPGSPRSNSHADEQRTAVEPSLAGKAVGEGAGPGTSQASATQPTEAPSGTAHADEAHNDEAPGAAAQTDATPTAAAQNNTGMPAATPIPDVSATAAQQTSFRIDEVQATQRYYNESSFVSKIRDVYRSLGKPKANLARVPSADPQAIVTIMWDIVWYQYLVDLRRDLPPEQEHVVPHGEGMDLAELPSCFREPNATVNDDGRIDASELEVSLLSDPSSLITEMSPEEAKLLEDATAEIWGQQAAPEFKWDD